MHNLQKIIFLKEEGDNYFFRNKRNLTDLGLLEEKDEIIKYFITSVSSVKNVLEIGCSNGWRLHLLNKIYKCKCYGVDPSLEAIKYGKENYPKIKFICSTADKLRIKTASFDHLIIGFCLYLCDREDLFKIAYEVDRVLADNGNIYILDFCPPFHYRRKYIHSEGAYSYKMDYSKLFLWNPVYNLIFQKQFSLKAIDYKDNPDIRLALSVLHKCKKCAYPDNPYFKETKST